ncbi:MAG: hydrogenase iron-sulfur subunit [Chlorobiaceae bacterium]
MSEQFEPEIVAFVCTYCTYAGADLAGTSRLKYAPNVRIIRLPCTGRISPMFILKALQKGADGVLISGCHPGDCHFTHGNYHARRRWMVFRALLNFIGIPPERIKYSWISAAEGLKFADLINSITEDIRKLGPFEQYDRLIGETQAQASL